MVQAAEIDLVLSVLLAVFLDHCTEGLYPTKRCCRLFLQCLLYQQPPTPIQGQIFLVSFLPSPYSMHGSKSGVMTISEAYMNFSSKRTRLIKHGYSSQKFCSSFDSTSMLVLISVTTTRIALFIQCSDWSLWTDQLTPLPSESMSPATRFYKWFTSVEDSSSN